MSDLTLWQEHDDDDKPERVYVVLCDPCGERLIEKHPRLYNDLHRHAPAPGAMVSLCLGCVHRDGVRCNSPQARANGGPGIKIDHPEPERWHVDGTNKRGRRVGWTMVRYPAAPTACSGREASETVPIPAAFLNDGDGATEPDTDLSPEGSCHADSRHGDTGAQHVPACGDARHLGEREPAARRGAAGAGGATRLEGLAGAGDGGSAGDDAGHVPGVRDDAPAGPLGAGTSFVVAFVERHGRVTLASRLGVEHDTLYTTRRADYVAYWSDPAAAEAWRDAMGFSATEPRYCRGRMVRAEVWARTPEAVAGMALDGEAMRGPLPRGVDDEPAGPPRREPATAAPPAPVTPPWDERQPSAAALDTPVKHDAPVKRPAPAERAPKADPVPDYPGCVWLPVPPGNLVRYCPGSAPGAPRLAPRTLVDRWLAMDSRYVEVVGPWSASAEPMQPPHDGPCAMQCPHWHWLEPEPGTVPTFRLEPVPVAEVEARREAERAATEAARQHARDEWRARRQKQAEAAAPVVERALAFSFGE